MENMIWNPRMECMSRDEIHEVQSERLRAVVRRVYENVPFYRNKMQELGVSPMDIQSIDDIDKLPFTTKQDLRDNYPFGMFAVPLSQITRVHASSGTTGKPCVAGYTSGDIDRWAENMARSMTCAGITKQDVVHVAYGYGLFTGGLGAHYGAERIGASVIPVSGGNTQRQIQLLQDFHATAIACTPSYALNLAENIAAAGIKKGELSLKYGVFGAEPWSEGMRERIEDMLGIIALDVYGLTEIQGPGVAMECPVKNGLHVWEDHFYVETIGKDDKPQAYGEQGDVTFTTLTKQGMPLLRYRTHDLATLDAAPCSCGRTHVRMSRITGRTDDMLIIRGVNVFPSQVEFALTRVPGITPNYQLIIDRVGTLDTMEVQVELAPEGMEDTVRGLENLTRRIEEQLASSVLVHCKVKLCQPGSLPRSEGKAKRIIDLRKDKKNI